MNLCVNARDAMPSGGTLTVETYMVEMKDPPNADDPPPGHWVVLSVGDTGTGIPEEVRPHLFEPFFTTKELGKGTGLGLSTVYGIVTTAGGHIRFTTATGKGTTFRIYLPAASGSKASPSAPAIASPVASSDSATSALTWGIPTVSNKQKPLLLLVDDQDAIRDLSARVLRETGFEVVTASSGNEAIGLLPDVTRPVTMLVTDMRMPGMTGREVASLVRAAHPSVKVLYISGDSEETSSANEAFLPKPFTIDELTDAVIALLGPRTHPDA
jgi:two-component system cell cycle sensor histidine kinase/response regulator CckA